jgi:hypothetical protein
LDYLIPYGASRLLDYLIPDDGAGGYRDYDEVSYAFTLPSAFTDGAGKALVRLVYQPTTKHHVEILEQANAGKNDRGAKLRHLGGDRQGGAVRRGRADDRRHARRRHVGAVLARRPRRAFAMTGSGRVPTYAASNPNAIGSHVGSRAGAAVRGCEGKLR